MVTKIYLGSSADPIVRVFETSTSNFFKMKKKMLTNVVNQ